MAEQRLQKVLAAAGVDSRRKCEELILEGAVCVNSKVVDTLPAFVDAEKDIIKVNGRRVHAARKEDPIRAEALCLEDRHGRVDAESPRLVARRRDDSPSGAAADYNGLPFEPRIVQRLDSRVECVHIDVGDNAAPLASWSFAPCKAARTSMLFSVDLICHGALEVRLHQLEPLGTHKNGAGRQTRRSEQNDESSNHNSGLSAKTDIMSTRLNRYYRRSTIFFEMTSLPALRR